MQFTSAVNYMRSFDFVLLSFVGKNSAQDDSTIKCGQENIIQDESRFLTV
jgi:hypothetical protein